MFIDLVEVPFSIDNYVTCSFVDWANLLQIYFTFVWIGQQTTEVGKTNHIVFDKIKAL